MHFDIRTSLVEIHKMDAIIFHQIMAVTLIFAVFLASFLITARIAFTAKTRNDRRYWYSTVLLQGGGVMLSGLTAIHASLYGNSRIDAAALLLGYAAATVGALMALFGIVRRNPM